MGPSADRIERAGPCPNYIAADTGREEEDNGGVECAAA